MAFLKFSRDKRGYEHFLLVEPTTRRGKTRSRILYFFRTPPNIRVGREPFDEEARRTLQAQNPGVMFDWPKILDTPLPAVDVEMWRERRRAEKAAKRAVAERRAERDADEMPSEPLGESEDAVGIDDQASPPAVADRPHEHTRKRRRRGRRGRTQESEIASPAASAVEPTEAPQPKEPHESSSRREPGERVAVDAPIEPHEPGSDQ